MYARTHTKTRTREKLLTSMILKVLFLKICFQLLLSLSFLLHLLLLHFTSNGLQTNEAEINMSSHIIMNKSEQHENEKSLIGDALWCSFFFLQPGCAVSNISDYSRETYSLIFQVGKQALRQISAFCVRMEKWDSSLKLEAILKRFIDNTTLGLCHQIILKFLLL